MELLKKNAKEYIILGLIYACLIVPLIYFGIVKELGIFVLPAIVAIPLFYFIFKKPEVWLYTSMGLFVLFTRSRDAEASPVDYFFAIYYIGGIILWILWQVLIKRQKIIRNYADMFIIFFSLCLIGNFFVSYIADVEPIKWLREASFLCIILFYFPIRHYFNTEKKLKPFLIFFAFTLIVAAAIGIYSYYNALSDMEYAFELSYADKINQMIFSVAIVFGLVYAFFQRKSLNQWLLISFIGIIAVALILTFSRTFWLIDLVMAVLLFFYLTFKKKIEMFKIAAVLFVFAIAGFVFMLGDKTQLIYSLLETRFTSSAAGAKDESMQARLVEWKYELGEIQKYPFSGKGMGSKVHFFNILTGTTYHTPTIHNGYIYLCYRLGIPMALLYLSFLIFYTIKAFSLSIRRSNPFFRALSIACFLGFLSVIIANVTSAQFAYRDGIFTIFLLVALTSTADDNINSKNNKRLLEPNIILPQDSNSL
jgi:hypothetical protein